MTDREAMKMALEALETKGEHHKRVYEAIEALRQALAQPKREWVGLTDEDKELLVLLWAPPIHPDFKDDDDFDDLLKSVEAKLKEKNAEPTAQTGNTQEK